MTAKFAIKNKICLSFVLIAKKDFSTTNRRRNVFNVMRIAAIVRALNWTSVSISNLGSISTLRKNKLNNANNLDVLIAMEKIPALLVKRGFL